MFACRDCYAIMETSNTGRCDNCWHSKDILPINYKRRPKRKDEEEE